MVENSYQQDDPILVMNIDLSEHETQQLVLFEDEDPKRVVHEFAGKYGLSKEF